MFEEVEAKRVCRADLRSRSSSPSSNSETDEEIQGLLQSRLAEVYGQIATIPTVRNIQTVGKADLELREDASEEGFEFRLFATSKRSKSPSDSKTARIILTNDEESLDGNGGFVIPWRDPRYYFTGEATTLQKQQYEIAAVSGDDVLRGLEIRHTGLEVPWRVSTLKIGTSNCKSSKAEDAAGVTHEEKRAETGQSKRKRMGKKMRILHRKREKIRKELELSEQQKLALKEATEREKKTRRNREKQKKKRAKEKAKKAGDISETGSTVPVQADIVMGEG